MELSATAGLAGTVNRVLAFALQATGADCAGFLTAAGLAVPNDQAQR
jgi:hypothetical protein